MKRLVTFTIVASALLLGSCGKNLNQNPKYGLNAEAVYSDPDNYIKVLAKYIFWNVYDRKPRPSRTS